MSPGPAPFRTAVHLDQDHTQEGLRGTEVHLELELEVSLDDLGPCLGLLMRCEGQASACKNDCCPQQDLAISLQAPRRHYRRKEEPGALQKKPKTEEARS